MYACTLVPSGYEAAMYRDSRLPIGCGNPIAGPIRDLSMNFS